MTMTLRCNVEFIDAYAPRIRALASASRGLKKTLDAEGDKFSIGLDAFKIRALSEDQFADTLTDFERLDACFTAIAKKIKETREYCLAAKVEMGDIIEYDVLTTVNRSTGRFVYADDPANYLIQHKSLRHAFLKDTNLIEIDATALEPTIAAMLSNDEGYLSKYRAGEDVYSFEGGGLTRDEIKVAFNRMINGGAICPQVAEQYPKLSRFVGSLKQKVGSREEFALMDGGTASFIDCDTPTQCASRVIQANGGAVLRLVLKYCEEHDVPVYGHLHDSLYVEPESVEAVQKAFKDLGFLTKTKQF